MDNAKPSAYYVSVQFIYHDAVYVYCERRGEAGQIFILNLEILRGFESGR